MTHRLVADIGGTNARFALLGRDATAVSNTITLQCAEFASFELALRHYLHEVGITHMETLCLAVAGPVVDESVNFTNNAWTISARDLAERFSGARIKLLNDFEAVAYALPQLESNHLSGVGANLPELKDRGNFRLCAIGPGTGLGCAGLLSQQGTQSVIVSEAGQTGFAPQTPVQLAVLDVLGSRFGRISNERLLSGPGIENIHWALTKIEGEPAQPLLAEMSAENIFTLADEQKNRLAIESVDLFFEVLGQVAGDIALSLYAIDGLYIAGGIARRYPQALTNSKFRAGFESKGKYRNLMERIPTHLITHENPGLLGAASYALGMQ